MSKGNDASLTARLTAFWEQFDENRIPAALQRQAKMLLADLAGVGIGGSLQEEVAPIHHLFRDMGGSAEATVWNYGEKLPVHAAALINASFSHALEMDDTHRFTYFHVGAVVIPPILALAERDHVRGKRLIKALIAGYETALRIALSVIPEHRLHGFHPTATVGVFGSAAACSVMLGLDAGQTVHALGLAGTQSSGLFQFQFDGCSAKRFHAGRAAQSGLIAALLAQKGFSGSPEILEGRYGFGNVMSPRFEPETIFDQLGTKWHIMEMGIKPYSACRFCHAPIDAARALRAHKDWDTAALESLELVCSRQLFDQTGGKSPDSPMGAQLSTPNAIALALLVGSNSPQAVERHFRDPEIMEMTRQIKLVVDDNLPRTSRHVILKARFKTGRELVSEVQLPTGEPENPMTPEAFRDKFNGLCAPVLAPERIDRLWEAISHIDKLEDAGALAPLMSR